jgi:hypothetical protein
VARRLPGHHAIDEVGQPPLLQQGRDDGQGPDHLGSEPRTGIHAPAPWQTRKPVLLAKNAKPGLSCLPQPQNGGAEREKFQSVRPPAADLALYQLDWMPTLKAAREKAAREGRPILLVVVTNSFGDLFSGHC